MNLQDMRVKLYVFASLSTYEYDDLGSIKLIYKPLRPEVGTVNVVHFFPCNEGDQTCINSKTGYYQRNIEM